MYFLRRFVQIGVVVGFIVGTAQADGELQLAVKVELDRDTGATSVPCGADGTCNIGGCSKDPDCPVVLPEKSSDPTLYPTASVATRCGGTIEVSGSDTPLGRAAADVVERYPNFNAAQRAKNPSYFDAHPSGALATGHGELAGFGVTMIQGKWPKPVENASASLHNPTLLFFRKVGNKQDDWSIIGMGYTFQFANDDMRTPTTFADIATNPWSIHEAGYHHSPGDGGFSCATNSDLKKSAFDTGKRVDTAGCFGIGKDELKTREFNLDSKHGRYWTTHVWFEPGTPRSTVRETDPWCRQGVGALNVPACAFFQRPGTCP